MLTDPLAVSREPSIDLGRTGETSPNQTNKSFLFLFFKKEALPSLTDLRG